MNQYLERRTYIVRVEDSKGRIREVIKNPQGVIRLSDAGIAKLRDLEQVLGSCFVSPLPVQLLYAIGFAATMVGVLVSASISVALAATTIGVFVIYASAVRLAEELMMRYRRKRAAPLLHQFCAENATFMEALREGGQWEWILSPCEKVLGAYQLIEAVEH